jgi:hypothetical protein
MIDQINVMNGGFAGINYLSFYLMLIPSMLVIFIVTLLVSIIVLGRMFEIFVYTAVAPLPVATLAGEMSHDTLKSSCKATYRYACRGSLSSSHFNCLAL